MELTPIHLLDLEVEDACMGAGVIPVSVDPSGRVCFLLGRERFIPKYKGSCRWSGFEGGRKENETVYQCAQREYQEESLGVMPPLPEEGGTRLDEEVMRIVIRFASDVERVHCTYLLFVPWEEDAPDRFLSRRHRLEDVDFAMQQLRMFPDVEHYRDRVQAALREARLEGEGEGGGEGTLHPALTTSVGEKGELADLHLNLDHMEKDCIRWWNVDDLVEVMQGRGSAHGDTFRPFFMPVLSVLLQRQVSEWVRARTTSSSSPEPPRCRPCSPPNAWGGRTGAACKGGGPPSPDAQKEPPPRGARPEGA